MSFEMGSFIELEYPNGKEYYKGDNVVRLNSGRTAMYHSIKSYNCKKVYLPIYQCETVKDFLIKKRIEIEFYTIDENFIPKMDTNEEDSCMIIVNYCGIFSTQYIKNIADKYKNVIIDNSQAFFSKPLENCLNVYSARKFFGVPDGAYVVGKPYLYSDDMYEDDHSSDTSLFLMQRIEYGCEGKAYASRTLNEERIDNSDIKNMSKFTRYLLDGIDYENVKKKRIENFNVVRSMLKEKNILEVAHIDSITEEKKWKALLKTNVTIKKSNPPETVIDKDSFVQIDNIIQLENFPKLETKRRQTDKLSNEKFNKVLKRYNEYKDNEWIDDNKKVFMTKEEIISLNEDLK